jgi:hypothetical protein
MHDLKTIAVYYIPAYAGLFDLQFRYASLSELSLTIILWHMKKKADIRGIKT